MSDLELIIYAIRENYGLIVNVALFSLFVWSAVRLYPFVKEIINDVRDEKE